jgi:leader peptidase (prepilin peptidase) / N-methyltransferase
MFAAWFDLAMFRDRGLLAAWLTVLGAVVGSFLNVVVYRLPAGKSLIHPGSQCPQCEHAIRWYDNLPIVGWFALRGRCRDCRVPISPRYPAVEALTAVMFLSVALAHVLWVLRDDSLRDAQDAVLLRSLLGRFAYLVTLLCCLQVAALIRYDGQRLPASLLWFMLLVGVMGPLVWPHLKGGYDLRSEVGLAIVMGATGGLVLTMIVGLVVRWLDQSRGASIEVGATLLAVGIYLGANAAGAVALVATLVSLLAAFVSRRRLPWIAYASLVTWIAVVLRAW